MITPEMHDEYARKAKKKGDREWAEYKQAQKDGDKETATSKYLQSQRHYEREKHNREEAERKRKLGQ